MRGLKVTGLASGASRACDVAATILEKMVQRNKVDLPLAKKVLRLTQRDFPDARVSAAAAKLNENPPALSSAAKILRAEANRLRAQGKSIKAMRAAVKRAPAEALPLIAPLHSKLLMIYRRFIGDPEGASLGNLPALAAQWKAAGNKLGEEEQSGAALIVRDLISAYRSFTKEQMKNTAYFLAMALGTANKMVGGSANVPIPAHLRAVKGEVTRKVVLNNARKRFLDNYKFKVADAEYEKPNPMWQGGKRLPTLLSAADVTNKVNEYIFANSGARYGKLYLMDMNAYAKFVTNIASSQGSALGIHHLFGSKPGGFANADTIVRIGANAWNAYVTKYNASIQSAARSASKSLTKHLNEYKMYTNQVSEQDNAMATKASKKPWERKLEPQTYITPQIWGVFKQRSPKTAAQVEEAVGSDGVTGRQLGNVTNDLRNFGEIDVLRRFVAQIKDWNARFTDPNYGNN